MSFCILVLESTTLETAEWDAFVVSLSSKVGQIIKQSFWNGWGRLDFLLDEPRHISALSQLAADLAARHSGNWMLEVRTEYREVDPGDPYHDWEEVEIEGKPVKIDKELTEIIRGLISLGNITTACDEEEIEYRVPGIGYISFFKEEGARYFYQLIEDHVDWVAKEKNYDKHGQKRGATIRFQTKDIGLIRYLVGKAVEESQRKTK